jgi:hypothetical protein
MQIPVGLFERYMPMSFGFPFENLSCRTMQNAIRLAAIIPQGKAARRSATYLKMLPPQVLLKKTASVGIECFSMRFTMCRSRKHVPAIPAMLSGIRIKFHYPYY